MSILEKIYEAGLKFLYPLSPQETYEIIVKEAVKLVNGDAGRLLLEENGELKNVYVSPTYSPLPDPRKRGYTHTSFSKNKAFMINTKQLKRVHPNVVSDSTTRSVIFIPMSNRGESYGVLLIRSRKNKKFTDNELRILKLFGSLASLAVRKTHSYEETKNALETRDLFISLAAHELRTPLTTINGYIQLLLKKIRDKKPIDNKWIMELALEGRRMEVLVNEFLEIDRIKRGKLQYNWSEHSMKKIVTHAIGNFRLNNPMRKLVYKNLVKGKKDIIVGDFDKIGEVITNILENAEKYSPDDKKISVILKYRSPYFVFTVIDQGQGIEEKDLPSIFRGFYKGRKSLHEGMGLGLYLAKSIIDSHKGEINIKSKVNKGTKVEIKLPKMERA